MRSGQYKLAGAGSRGAESRVTVVGHFRSSQSDLPPPDAFVGDFPHMNSLLVTKNKLSDSRPFNKSCENLSTSGGGARGAVMRVEQRVKSLLQRGESRLRHSDEGAPVEDVWQYGHIVTLPRRPRLSLALSHSALHHLSSDTASCLSGSSGYSSSSSSSYGSFKSSTSSSCSTLPRKKSRRESSAIPSGGDLPPPLTRSCTLVDNPMYDVTPATNPRNFSRNKSPKRRGSPPPSNEPLYDLTPDSDPYNLDLCEARQGSPSTHDPIYDVIPGGDPHSPCRESLPQCHNNQLYDLTRPSRLLTPDSGTHGGLDSLEESALDSLDCSDPQNGMLDDEFFEEEDQVAKECREYFERRLKNSETLKKRWSMCSSDSGADPGDNDVSATSIPTSAHPLSIASNTSSIPDDSNTSHSSSATQDTASPKKTPLDQKMEFLRKEIASLMNQDNALFRQLLTLHDSISALKTSPAHAYRPPSPASLDSFTEEEDDDDDDEEEEEDDDDDEVVVGRTLQKTGGRDDNLSDVDEGLEMDHSTSHSTSPTSTLSSNSSRDSQFSRYSKVEYHDPHHILSDSSNTSLISTNTPTAHISTKNNINVNYSSIKNNIEECNSTTNFSSDTKRRYSITTNEDFNINITINNDDSSTFPSTTSRLSSSTSCLSKSSCYLSNEGLATNDLNMDSLRGSLDSFSAPEGRHFVRTRVSIPPSARNRDRSARPESFRLSSDMATHTRVLLKARSFAGASLRESPTHKINGGRTFARTSLRENRQTYHREKGQNQQSAMSKMEFLQARFANTFGATSGENTLETPSDDCVIISSSSIHDVTRKPEKEGFTQEFTNKENKSVNVRSAEVYTTLEATNIVIVNTPKPEKHLENTKGCYKQGNSKSPKQASITEDGTFILADDDLYNNITNQSLRESALSLLDQDISSHNPTEKDPDTHNQTTHKVSLMVPNSYINENYQDSKLQKLRTRSFTGMVTPCEISPDQSSPREILDDSKINKKGTLSLRITHDAESKRISRVATMSRRAQITRDGYAFRFSSDLGLGASSKVNPKSKREVFV
ncbi:serine-rich adhesin for platelets [Procambarus clarkii]|uniref:serine-rich adhesin for platelets n=1 Tax=Procambarus clarkii TaxID=6728 RepID=UPI003742B461